MSSPVRTHRIHRVGCRSIYQGTMIKCRGVYRRQPQGYPHLQSGFSLLEMAITLAILGILLSTMLPSLATHMENQRNRDTRASLQQIRETLLAHAAIHGRLPCPTRESDPSATGYGLEYCDDSIAEEGYLPWRSLGVPATDAWGSIRLGRDDAWRNHWLYRVDSLFAIAPFSLDDTTGSGNLRLEVRDDQGRLLTNRGQPPVALVCSMGSNGQMDGGNATVESAPQARYQLSHAGNTFDDICVWISRPMLVSALLHSGRLP